MLAEVEVVDPDEGDEGGADVSVLADDVDVVGVGDVVGVVDVGDVVGVGEVVGVADVVGVVV